MSLSREAFLKKAAVPVEEVNLPELGGSVFVHGMTANERNNYESQFWKRNGDMNQAARRTFRQRLIVQCVRDENGAALFTMDDLDAIGSQPIVVIERLVDVAQRLCGMGQQDVEELAGNDDG